MRNFINSADFKGTVKSARNPDVYNFFRAEFVYGNLRSSGGVYFAYPAYDYADFLSEKSARQYALTAKDYVAFGFHCPYDWFGFVLHCNYKTFHN